MTRDNQSNGQPSLGQFSIEMARGSSNLSNEVAGSSGIINVDDNDAIDHLPIQSMVLSDSSSSFTFWEDMYRDSIRLGATHLMEVAHVIPTRDITSASGWATCPPDTSVNQIGNQSLLDQHQDFSNFHTNAAEFSGLSLHEESWNSLPSQSLQAHQVGIENFIPRQNNSMSSVPVSRHIPDSRLLGTTDHAMKNVPEFVGLTGDITTGSGRGDSPIGISVAQIADRSFLHPCQDFSSFQRNATGLSGLSRNDGWSSFNDSQWLMTGNDGLTSFPFQNIQTEQVGMQQPIPLQNNNRNSSCGWRRDSFSRPDQLGNLGIPQEREPFQHYIDLNSPAFFTERPCPASISNNFLMNDERTCIIRQVPLASTGQGALNEYICTQSFGVPTGQIQKTASNQSSPAVAANVRNSLPQCFHAPSPSDGQVTRAANELKRTQSFGVSIGQLQKTSSNQVPPAITANDSSVVPSNFNRSFSTGPHIPVANVEQASRSHAGSSVKRKATRPSLMNRPSVQRTKMTPFPSSQLPVSFANQNGASTASAQLHVSIANQNAVSVASAQPPVSFANQNTTSVASALPLIPFANQNAARIASARPLVSFANQNAASIASAPPPVSLANQNAASMASARLPVSFANQNAARRASARLPVSSANQIATSVASVRPPVSFANQNAARIASAKQAVSFANQNSTSIASAGSPVSFANQNAARIFSAQMPVLLANQNDARISSAQPTVSFADQKPATVASAQPPIPFACPDASITQQRVRIRGPSTRQRVRTRGPSSGLQSSLPVPSTLLQNRMPVPSFQQQSRAHPSLTQPQNRGHPSYTQLQSGIPLPSAGLPGITPIFYIKQKVDPSCRPTGKIQAHCELCHKDLSEKPDGVASSEHAPAPMSAVLPCGHVFHNHCLEIITPPDQSENPPCIPCSIADHQS